MEVVYMCCLEFENGGGLGSSPSLKMGGFQRGPSLKTGGFGTKNNKETYFFLKGVSFGAVQV